MSKPQASRNLLKNSSIFQSVEISRLSCHFLVTLFSVSQSQAPFHCCFTSSVLWRGSLQKFCQAVRCKPSRLIDEDTLVSQQARLQTIWRSTTKTSKILRRRWHNGRNLVKRACQPRHRPNRPNRRELGRKKATKSVCGPWFVIYELERMLFEIQ